MSLTRLDNLYSSKTGKYLYVSPDDFNATDTLDNRGNSPLRPFKTIQRAFLEVARFSYQPGANNDRFDQFSIMLMPGDHYIDNRPGLVNYSVGGTSNDRNRFFDAGDLLEANKDFIANEAYAIMLSNNPGFVTPTGDPQDCIDDVLDFLDALIYNVKFGGNDKVFDAALLYQDEPTLIQNELAESKEVYDAAQALAKDVISNTPVTTILNAGGFTQTFDTTISLGPTTYGDSSPDVPYGEAETCADVKSAIDVLFFILDEGIDQNIGVGALDFTDRQEPPSLGELPVFGFNQSTGEWDDNSIIDLSNPDNIYWKYNASSGGAIVPRGCSLVGYDLRRTIVRPLYVPDPADSNQERTSIFNLTGGCYLWQFTIKDGDLSPNSPLFDPVDNVGKVYYQKGNIRTLRNPEYSHHKICIMTYAELNELDAYYEKVATSFSLFQPTIDDPNEFDALVQENRIVGPLSDTRSIEKLLPTDLDVTLPTQRVEITVTTKIDHGYFKDQFIAILNTGLDDELNGTFKVASIDPNDPKVFTYEIPGKVAAGLGLINGVEVISGAELSVNAVAQAEIDSVESASPYVFNCSIRSIWGQCGMWADGSKASGFKSMVVAQYTGVSLQKDDRAFIRYDEFTNTWNQASLVDAFATVPYHTKGDAYWKDDWRNFHIRASEDAFIQCVSVFAVGFFDHFLMESGGDMSITNSNSNFGNTSLHSIGHKGFSFNQDKGGYVTEIIPPQELLGRYRDDSTPGDLPVNSTDIAYYPIDIAASNDNGQLIELPGGTINTNRLYLGTDDAFDPDQRPAATLNGYRIGARPGEKIYAELEPFTAGGNTLFNATLTPTGVNTFNCDVNFLNPTGISINNKAQDAANTIDENKTFIQDEVYGFITTEYPGLLTSNAIDITTCYRDIGYYVDAIVQDLKLGGNINSIQAAEAYFVNNNLIYIENELAQTEAALGVTEALAIAAMRNFDYLLGGCETTNASSTVTVPSTAGLAVGMKVESYSAVDIAANGIEPNPSATPTATIPADTYIVDIVGGTQIVLGQKGGYTWGGATPVFVPAAASLTNVFLWFTLRDEPAGLKDGIFSNLSTEYDDTITDDTANQTLGETECDETASVISGLFADIIQILNSDPQNSGVDRIEPTQDFSVLTTRATLFTATGVTAHNMETGTPVRLTPKPAAGTNPDPRVIRLPKGFETNTKYYVIAPGRITSPENYSTVGSIFEGTDQRVFMLATTLENAKAGNYIYSPETDTIDDDVVIEVNQFILDDKYDLYKYESSASQGNAGEGRIRTKVNHQFDVPTNNANVEAQTVFFREFEGNPLPTFEFNGNTLTVDPQQSYFVRYKTNNTFDIYLTKLDAESDVNILNLNIVNPFLTYSNKRFTPLRFEPRPTSFGGVTSPTGQWYLQVLSDWYSPVQVAGSTAFVAGPGSDPFNILYRFTQFQADTTYSGSNPAEIRTQDTFFERVLDDRVPEDRIYKLKYVIPKYLETVRDPLNGFVIKVRTDSRRRLKPQKLILKPILASQHAPGSGYNNNSIATFFNDNTINTDFQDGLKIGFPAASYPANTVPNYEPYANPKIVETLNGKFNFTIQGAKVIEDPNGNSYLEVIAYDHTITQPSIKNERFTVVKIKPPQGGSGFVGDANNNTQPIEWTGFSSGTGFLHGVFTTSDKPFTSSDPTDQDWFLVIKGVLTGEIKYNPLTEALTASDPTIETTFTQGATFAVLDAKPDSVGDADGLSKSDRDDYLYAIRGANLFTMVPGDIIEDDNSQTQYYIDSVEDVGELEDTFYIFRIEELTERIPGQQDGEYYLTCLRGNVSPFPTGPGVGENFRNFKFSQPIGFLYPVDYTNDPIWYEQLDPVYYGTDINDPPATYSAADNFTHGLVTVNDFRYSETKEAIIDLTEQPALSEYTFENQNGIDARIRAQEGLAEAGAQDRSIPIKGVSTTQADSKLYVELRRPSIARSGNHTFEYLGFGPGNYSTGFPLRQEVILTDEQDFYAQAKREDGGIVFYTGLNSNGDLYIGNKKVNAITGEETFLESAELNGFGDEDDLLGAALVTTFITPVTFKDKILVKGNSTFTAPVSINVQTNLLGPDIYSLSIASLVNPDTPDFDDPTLANTSFAKASDGNITLSKNRIESAIFAFNPRGNGASGIPGQDYSFRTHYNFLEDPDQDGTPDPQPSNMTPNNTPLSYPADPSSNKLFGDQNVYYGNLVNVPQAGDILFKGKQTNKNGSLGWIYANTFNIIPNDDILTVATPKINEGTSLIEVDTGGGIGYENTTFFRLYWNGITTQDVVSLTGLNAESVIRIVGATGTLLSQTINGRFKLYLPTFNPVLNPDFIDIETDSLITFDTFQLWQSIDPQTGDPIGPGLNAEVSISNSDWKELGVIGAEALRTETTTLGEFKLGINTVARSPHSAYANSYIDPDTTDPRANLDVVGNAFISGKGTPDYRDEANPGDRAPLVLDNAFLVGGDSETPNLESTFRIATSGGGKVGINVTNSELDRNLVVDGNARITGDFRFENDIDIDGGGGSNTADVRTAITDGIFNFVSNAGFIGTLNVGENADTINIGSLSNNFNIAEQTLDATTLNAFVLSDDLRLTIGNPAEDASISRLNFGGAYDQNQSNSVLTVKTKQTNIWGDLAVGLNKAFTDTLDVTGSAGTVNFFSNSGATSTLNFAVNAASINMGAQGGITTIRNSLTVDATLRVRGSSIVVGGTASFEFNADRSQLGSTQTAHTGYPNGIPEDKNVDFVIFTGEEIAVDTAGAGTWGGSFFQDAIPTFLGDDNSPLPALTGNQYYLPLVSSPDGVFAEGDDIVVDSPTTGGGHPEILRVAVGGLRRINTAPYFIIVERQPYGTFLPTRSDHPDTTLARRVNVALNTTWLTVDVDATGAVDIVNLSEFGGELPLGSYLFLSRTDDGTSGEAVLVGTSVSVINKRFQIFNGVDVLKFDVDSITGATTISDNISNGGLTVYGPTNLVGPASTLTLGGNLTVNAETVFNDSVRFPDNISLYFGDDDDGEIVHGPDNATSIRSLSRDLRLQTGSTFVLEDSFAGRNYIRANFDNNGEVDLYYNDDIKLTTTNDGILLPDQLEVTNESTFQDVVTFNSSQTVGGIDNYITTTGARKWVYIPTTSNSEATVSATETLIANTNYFVRPTGSETVLILKLPTGATTGDMVRIIDIAGNLTYNTQLVVRAPVGVRIQGDNTGSLLGLPGTTPYNGGELVVNTPNAGFGLIYVGNLDADANTIEGSLQGWRLVEI